MTREQIQTINECADATRLHVTHLRKRLKPADRVLFDDVFEGMDITATKLESLITQHGIRKTLKADKRKGVK